MRDIYAILYKPIKKGDKVVYSIKVLPEDWGFIEAHSIMVSNTGYDTPKILILNFNSPATFKVYSVVNEIVKKKPKPHVIGYSVRKEEFSRQDVMTSVQKVVRILLSQKAQNSPDHNIRELSSRFIEFLQTEEYKTAFNAIKSEDSVSDVTDTPHSGFLDTILRKLGCRKSTFTHVSVVGFQIHETQTILNALESIRQDMGLYLTVSEPRYWHSIAFNKKYPQLVLLKSGSADSNNLLPVVKNSGIDYLLLDSVPTIEELRLALARISNLGLKQVITSHSRMSMVVHSTGGVGKTTILLGLAYGVAKQGVASAIVDIGQGGLESLGLATPLDIEEFLRNYKTDYNQMNNVPRYYPKSGLAPVYVFSVGGDLSDGTKIQEFVRVLHNNGVPSIFVDTKNNQSAYDAFKNYTNDFLIPITKRETTISENEAMLTHLGERIAALFMSAYNNNESTALPNVIIVYNQMTEDDAKFAFPAHSQIVMKAAMDYVSRETAYASSDMSINLPEIKKTLSTVLRKNVKYFVTPEISDESKRSRTSPIIRDEKVIDDVFVPLLRRIYIDK